MFKSVLPLTGLALFGANRGLFPQQLKEDHDDGDLRLEDDGDEEEEDEEDELDDEEKDLSEEKDERKHHHYR